MTTRLGDFNIEAKSSNIKTCCDEGAEELAFIASHLVFLSIFSLMTFRYRIDKKNLLMMPSNSSVNFLQCIKLPKL